MPAGRPRIPYDPELGEMICERIATSTMGLADVLESLAKDGVATPGIAIVYRWLANEEDFRAKSARARELQGDTLIDLAMKHALEPMVGTTTTTKEWGEEVKTGDNVHRSQLIVQTILKRAGQLAPKKYGERLDLNVSGELSLADRLKKARAQVGE